MRAVGCGRGEGTGIVIDTQAITEPGHYIRNLGVDGLPRNFEMYVPTSVDFSKSSPMVLAFHSNPQSSVQMRAMSDLDASADTLGVVIVYPNKAHGADWFWGCDECSIAGLNQIDDPKYIQAVIDKVALDMNIDLDRVYATGFRFYRVEGGGHTWPGSPVDFGPGLGKRSDDFHANDEILGFFLRHSR